VVLFSLEKMGPKARLRFLLYFFFYFHLNKKFSIKRKYHKLTSCKKTIFFFKVLSKTNLINRTLKHIQNDEYNLKFTQTSFFPHFKFNSTMIIQTQ